jgi:ATP-dependent Clp protease adaptor protein ClpS
VTQDDQQGDVATQKKSKTKAQKPRMFKVIFHNDDFTTMEFVVRALETIFDKSPAEATQVMLQIHKRGQGLAGVYSRQVAETKVHHTKEWAHQEGHPLMVTMEPE